MKRIILDFQGLGTAGEIHEYLKRAFGFPDFYGGNADALWDCLNGWFDGPVEIVLRNISTGTGQLKVEVQRVMEVFQDLVEADPRVTFRVE